MLVYEHGTKFGEPVGRVAKRVQDHGAFVDSNNFTSSAERTLEPVGEVVGAGVTDEVCELVDGVGGDGEAGERHPARRSPSPRRHLVEPVRHKAQRANETTHKTTIRTATMMTILFTGAYRIATFLRLMEVASVVMLRPN